MILYHESNDVTAVKKYTDTHSDVLVVKLKVYDKYLMIVLVYMSVNDMEKYKEIMTCIEKHIKNKSNYLVMGDFNGHIGHLGPHTTNKNGQLMLGRCCNAQIVTCMTIDENR